jgi:DNA polymerase-3 subunit delta'
VSEAPLDPPLFYPLQAQDSALQILQHALDHDRVAHAYLFEGPSGVGKERAALQLAAALLCPTARAQTHTQSPCVCAVCERIRAGNHPDVRIFRPRDEGNRNLPVEVIRTELLPFAKFAPFEAENACVIFPEADVSFPIQHAEAANALLKTLEEPRPRVRFVLLAERPDRLLPTIRSRCQRVRFRPLPAAVLSEILERHGVPAAVRDTAIALAQGRADRALVLAQDDGAELLLELVLRVDAAVTSGRGGDLLNLADELAKHTQLDLVLSTLALFYRDVAQLALRGDAAPLSFPQCAERLRASADRLGPVRAAEHVAAINAILEAIERNANPEIALDALLLGFATGTIYVAAPHT